MTSCHSKAKLPNLHNRDAVGPPRAPLISVVIPAFETPPDLLQRCIRSILSQEYDEWELIIVDDGSESPSVQNVASEAMEHDKRIKLISRSSNGNISCATNDGLWAASGDFVVFVDHDDELTSDALRYFAEVIVDEPQIDVLYSDQLTCDEQGTELHHFFKPEWSPVYFLGVMYIGHLLGVRRSLALSIGGFNSSFDGVQDFEFVLRLSEKTTRIKHIPRVLYKWRAVPGSIATRGDAKSGIDDKQRLAVATYLKRIGRSWRPESHGRLPHRLKLRASELTPMPAVSIVIPSRDNGDIITRCLSSIVELTEYSTFEIIVVDNGTVDPIALAAFQRFSVNVVQLGDRFNYSRANNVGVQHAKHDVVLFLNNDTEVLEQSWLRDLTMYLEDPGVGAVGTVLLYPNRTVQHAGVVLGCRGTADHVMRSFPEEVDGYSGSLACSREVSAVTAACLLMRKELYAKLGGFSEDYAKHYQDVDLCLRIRDAGYRIICAARPRLIHHEGLTRAADGYDLVDRAILLDRWYECIKAPDPYYNRALDLDRLDYSLATNVPG
jgi:glycosyltransferase involved in cell wall biosynthesis